ncbi:RNA pseudouridylate synthase domain-containing protein 2-like [Patiria miniata]|uniref:Pseudouridylate synthase RPUSD2 n=1 Tax=Patiria miniata TaxID=46514 RepID=A0A914AT04_PATMI|nr:RNA pseudouridylate synthase domain-containing protein 2-like [Patiria miniata]
MVINLVVHMRFTPRTIAFKNIRSIDTLFNAGNWKQVLNPICTRPSAGVYERDPKMAEAKSGTVESNPMMSRLESVSETAHQAHTDCEAKTDRMQLNLKRKEFSGKTKKGKKLDKHPKKVQKFSNDQKFEETTYYFDNGLRKVTPYVYVFETHIKGRWMGRSVLDVFKGEFRMETPEYYKKAISYGLITINGQRVSADKILRNNEYLRSMVHRHEPPVTGEPLDILTINEEFVVINKPASVPVHPCGKYRHNTIIFMLGKEHGLTGLHTIHRLDRLTSGLLMFARTREVSQRVDAYVRDRRLTKVYVCKVTGEFPSEPVECLEPICTVSHKIGVCKVGPDGKQCKTSFKRLSYDGHTSIVQCTPHTGRMHQIRVHLQYLGYPIVNDPLYNNPVWGTQLGKGGDIPHTDEDLLTELIKQHTAELKSQVIEDPDMFIKTTRHQLVPGHDAENEDRSSSEGATSSAISAVRSNGVGTTDLDKSTSDAIVDLGQRQGETDAAMELTSDSSDKRSTACLVSDEHSARNENTNNPTSERGTTNTVDLTVVETSKTGSHDQTESSLETSEASSEPPSLGSGQGLESPLESERELTEAELHRLVQRLCRECKLKLRDPTPDEMIMYLHALSYKGPDFEFSTPLPKWAEEHIQRSSARD